MLNQTRINEIALTTAVSAGSGALMGTWIGGPVGALGGALFGAVRSVAFFPMHTQAQRVLHTPEQNQIVRILAITIDFFGSFALAWSALALAGFSLTLSQVMVLSAATIGSLIVLNLMLNRLGIHQSWGMP